MVNDNGSDKVEMMTMRMTAATRMADKLIAGTNNFTCACTTEYIISSHRFGLTRGRSMSFFASLNPSSHFEKGHEDVLVIPSNLHIDHRVISKPFYGSNTIRPKTKQENEKYYHMATSSGDEIDVSHSEECTTHLSSKVRSIHDIMKKDKNGKVETKKENIYQFINDPEPLYVKPLLERLCIPIVHFGLASASPQAEERKIVHLSSSVFGCDPIRVDILHRCVVHQRNRKRGRRNAGARTKTISEVAGSGRKVRQQKGTGMARAGHRRPAHWRGGAKAHGPKGRVQNYETKLNKKVKKLGVRMALSQKVKEGNLVVVNGFEGLFSHKTHFLSNILEQMFITGRYGTSAYIVDHVEKNNHGHEEEDFLSILGVSVNLSIASRNIDNVKVTSQRNINVYDLLKYERVVMSHSAVQALEQRLRM